MSHLSLNTPIGVLTLFEEEGALVAVEWGRAPAAPETPLLKEARHQLDAYFDRRLRSFDLPLRPSGTPFQRRVWSALEGIPYATVVTYGDLAGRLGTAPRGIGGACGRNPLAVVVPCHRVIGAGGRLVGYSGGQGLVTKRALLLLEGAAVD